MTTLTVQLFESDLPQPELEFKLGVIVGELRRQGVTKSATVEAVFPGHQDPRRRSTFMVQVRGGENEVVSCLNKSPEVERAYVAPTRGALSR